MTETPVVSRRIGPGWWLALALVSGALYASNWNDTFIGDDYDLIHSFQDKPSGYLPALLWNNESGDVWKSWGIDPDLGRGYLRPLKIWILAADFAIWRTNAFGYHLTSSACFVAIVLLVCAILRRVLPERPILAVAGACAAAFHPVFSEIVPFITAREELLATVFGLAAFLAFLRFRDDGRSSVPFHVSYACALLIKESAIVVLALPLARDLVDGRLWPPTRALSSDVVRTYAPSAAILSGYFGLRWIAFGNFVGGDGGPVHYFSPSAFVDFHRHFWRSLVDPTLLAPGSHPWAGPGAAILGACLLAALVGTSGRLTTRRRRDLILYGPLWYLGSTTILYGTYFAVRHHCFPVVGLVLFATLTLDSLLAGGLLRGARVWSLLMVLTSALLFLPPSLETSSDWRFAASAVAKIRKEIAFQTRGLGPPCAVRLSGVPQWILPPFYFGWGLRSALARPFDPADLAGVCTVIDDRNLELTRETLPLPERFDAVIEFEPASWTTPAIENRYLQRLWRDGIVPPGLRSFP